MSAFMVPATHINAMVNAFAHYGRLADPHFHQRMTDESAARMLVEANRASINYRYPDTVGARDREPGAELGDTITVKPLRRMPSRVEAWQLINCYEYQACEPADWETSPAARWCRDFRRVLVESLPSYAEAAAKAPYVWETL